MPNNLDKLKALTDRLDDRLARKREASRANRYASKSEASSSNSRSKSIEEAVDLINVPQAFKLDEESPKIATPLRSDHLYKETIKKHIYTPSEKVNTPLIEIPTREEKGISISSQSDITVLIKAEEAENIRKNNIIRVKELYKILKIYEKSPDFDNIFMYKAMNLSGIGLKDDDFGIIRAGKYIQIIAITYEPDISGKKKAKNISLGYFGKGETIDPELKNNVIEFVLCWRYEKAFQNVEHYKNLLARVERQLEEETISL